MLLSYEVTSAANAKAYFASSVSPEAVSSRQGYYSEGQESPGVYGGKLAAELGLAGKVVDEATFHRLCDNLHPTENHSLTPRTNDFRRICYDFTVSGPKSFSVIEALAPPEERVNLRQAFDDAVNDMVAEDLEPDMQTRERKNGADYDITTGNILTVSFDHGTARPENDDTIPDPHWHKHLLVWNATKRPDDGEIKAGQFGNIIRDKSFYRASFYSRLAQKLEALGYVIDRRGDTDWEIAGVPQTVIDKFSKRTIQIEAAARKRGITDAAEKAGLGAKIRAKKVKDLKLPELRKAWAAQMTDDERSALATVYAKGIAPGKAITPAEAVSFALAHIGEKLSVFPERELKRVALLYGLGSVSLDQVSTELPRHGVITDTINGRLYATTASLQNEEDTIASVAAKGRGAVMPIGRPDGLTRTLAEGKALNDGQFETVTGLLESSNRVNLVEGPAGAGKSTLLAAFNAAANTAGQAVTYLATTTPAVEVLRTDSFDAHTVARFLVDEKMQAAARGGRVVIDESSMLGHKAAVKLMGLVEKLDLKPIFVGDPMQHGAVDRGSFLHVLKEYGCVRPYRLTEILRQQSPEYRLVAKALSEGDTLAGFDRLDAMGWIQEQPEAEARYHALAADYRQALDAGKTALVVSPTHAEAAQVTQAIRAELRQAGRLGAEEHEFTRLVAIDTTEAERKEAFAFRPGDVLVFHQNAVGFKKGARLTVTDPAQVPLSEASKFSVFRPEAIALAKGDVIRFTGTVKTLDGEHSLRNGNLRTVAEITPGGRIRLDNGWLIGSDAGHFRYGYVETSFGSQGRTVDRALLAMSAGSVGATNQEQLYVSSTRSKERMTLYTDDKAAIRQAAARSSQKLAALDLKPAAPTPGLHQRHDLHHRRRLAYGRLLSSVWAKATRRLRRPAPPSRPAGFAERLNQQPRSHTHER
jgi:conjugative relaxase-like TrwC/TraI family protein